MKPPAHFDAIVWVWIRSIPGSHQDALIGFLGLPNRRRIVVPIIYQKPHFRRYFLNRGGRYFVVRRIRRRQPGCQGNPNGLVPHAARGTQHGTINCTEVPYTLPRLNQADQVVSQIADLRGRAIYWARL